VGITDVQVISVPVSDQERSLAFYRDVLGFEVEADAPMGPTMRWLQLRVPGTAFTITLVTWFDDMSPGSMRGLVLGVDDIDEFSARLHAGGHLEDAVVQEQPWGRFVVVSDPDDNSIIFSQPPG
jgi:catechol 2,3-dioxygenase-like lactoylglutathione lyase family enzyme